MVEGEGQASVYRLTVSDNMVYNPMAMAIIIGFQGNLFGSKRSGYGGDGWQRYQLTRLNRSSERRCPFGLNGNHRYISQIVAA